MTCQDYTWQSQFSVRCLQALPQYSGHTSQFPVSMVRSAWQPPAAGADEPDVPEWLWGGGGGWREGRGHREGLILLYRGSTLKAGPGWSTASHALTPTSTGASRKQKVGPGCSFPRQPLRDHNLGDGRWRATGQPKAVPDALDG